ncbi:hypothetical protein SO802_011662 [Lithocarpus litseifolius]|uniref:Uncharacterized protein n=1 Tax=Lithocarpus litseifolius TaxID=425828 RepID=A0AAW2D619_9ROSI
MLCSAHDDSVTTVSDQESIQSQRIFLLLCPNVLLCEQMVRMVNVFVAMMVNRFIKLQLSVMGSGLESEPSSHFTLEDKEGLQTDIISEGEENSEDVHVDELAEDVEAGSNKTKDWRRVKEL